MPTKTCSQCSVEKDHSEFNRRKRNRDGYRSECRDCQLKYGEKLRSKHVNNLNKNVENKFCGSCQTTKDAGEFHKNRGRATGLSDHCKSCVKEQHDALKLSRIENGFKIPEQKKCSQCLILKSRLEFHFDTASKDGLCHLCKTCSRIKNREYRERNPTAFSVKNRIHHNKRRCEGSHTPEDIALLFEKQNNKCVFDGINTLCQHDLTKYDIDHILPISKGGDNNINNIQILCYTCNRMKYDKTMAEFNEYLKWIKCFNGD